MSPNFDPSRFEDYTDVGWCSGPTESRLRYAAALAILKLATQKAFQLEINKGFNLLARTAQVRPRLHLLTLTADDVGNRTRVETFDLDSLRN